MKRALIVVAMLFGVLFAVACSSGTTEGVTFRSISVLDGSRINCGQSVNEVIINPVVIIDNVRYKVSLQTCSSTKTFASEMQPFVAAATNPTQEQRASKDVYLNFLQGKTADMMAKIGVTQFSLKFEQQ